MRRLSFVLALCCAGCLPQLPQPAPPIPDVPPAPGPVITQSSVLLLYEKDDLQKYSRSQRAILQPAPEICVWLDSRKVPWHMYDKDVPVVGDDPVSTAWRALLAKVKPDYAGTPLLIIDPGSGPIKEIRVEQVNTPADVVKTLESIAIPKGEAEPGELQDAA